MKNQPLDANTVCQLNQLLEKKSWLRQLKKETRKEKQKFDLEVLELKISFLKAKSEEEKKQIIKRGDQAYQVYKRKMTELLNLAQEV